MGSTNYENLRTYERSREIGGNLLKLIEIRGAGEEYVTYDK
jgi:hypothetical protein